MSNQYAGYCIDCQRQVKPGHGDLHKRNGKYVVSCGRAATAKQSPPPPAKPERPTTGNRLSDLRITSQNAVLSVGFRVDGVGYAMTYAPFQHATAIKYKRHSAWTPDLAKYAGRENDPESHRADYDRRAAEHAIVVEENESLYAALKASGQIAYDNEHEFTFLLSQEEEAASAKLIAEAKEQLLAAILDGTATIDVREVGCDFPHPQVCGVTLPGADKSVEYALLQNLLAELRLKVDGRAECADLSSAIRAAQKRRDKSDAERAAHIALRARGYHIVALRRCWECGRTEILGEYNDNYHVVRMQEQVYIECVAAQREGHARSMATVPAGEIISSVGFDPNPAHNFDFRVAENDWYCGC